MPQQRNRGRIDTAGESIDGSPIPNAAPDFLHLLGNKTFRVKLLRSDLLDRVVRSFSTDIVNCLSFVSPVAPYALTRAHLVEASLGGYAVRSRVYRYCSNKRRKWNPYMASVMAVGKCRGLRNSDQKKSFQ